MLFQDRHHEPAPLAPDIPLEARREAVGRVLASVTLKKSARLRELLSYLAERSLKEQEPSIPEQEIGIAVFGRKDYSASQDNLVRVHATQLRKKLDHYFSTEGAQDGVVFEILRGSYALQFERRNVSPGAGLVRAGLPRWLLAALAVVAGVGLVLAGWFARGVTLEARVAQPTVRQLWSQFFENGRETHILLADANVTMFQDFVRQTLGLREYGRPTLMQRMVEQRFEDPYLRTLILRVSGKYFVTLADAAAARKIEALGLGARVNVRYGFARGFNVEHLMADNAILLGNRRANPWVELFDSRLRFRYQFDDNKVASRFEDTEAPHGEPGIHPTRWERESHCQVAMLPNLRETGSVLIIAGGDQSAAEAGSEFLTSERWVVDLARRLGVTSGKRFPYFEVLLKTETVSSTAPAFSVVSCRAIQ